MPSPTISTSPGSARRTAPPRHGPSIIFCGSTGALPLPSRARKVRWIASGVSSAPRVTSATIAGQMPPEGCFSPAWKRSVGRRRQIAGRARRDRSRPASRRPASRTARWRARPRCAWRRRDPAGASATAARRASAGADRVPSTGRATGARRSPAPGRSRHGSGPAPCRRRRADRQARLAVVMGRAARHPAAARLAPAEGLGDGLSGDHGGAASG